jgi:chromosome segregation ATPase
MDGSLSEIGIYMLAALAAGLAVGWLLKSALSKRQINAVKGAWQTRLDDATEQRDRSRAEVKTLKSSIDAQQAVIYHGELAVSRVQTELNSALEKEKFMAENIFTLRSEREEFKTKMSTFQNRMAPLQQQSADLQTEFLKSRAFYVGELKKSFEKRKVLEDKLKNTFKEYESARNLLDSSRSAQDSVNKMLEAARNRLENLDALEQSAIRLESQNAQLHLDLTLAKQEIDALNRDVAEQEELIIQNRELSQVLKSMENTRKQHEDDANRYRDDADKYETKSETLRLRLSEVERNFAEMERQQRQAFSDARRPAEAEDVDETQPELEEIVDLKEIFGIG